MACIVGKTVTETFLSRVKATPSQSAFLFKPTNEEMGPVGQWKTINFLDFYQECERVSLGLMRLGLQAQNKVILFSTTRIEWSLCDMAIMGAQAVTVPIYASTTPPDAAYIVHHSEARFMIVEKPKHLEDLLKVRAQKPELFAKIEKIIVLEPDAMKLGARYGDAMKDVMTYQALKELGKREQSSDPSRFEKGLLASKAEDLITICYTSGTTGTPKGVMITHGNIMSVMDDCVPLLGKHIVPEEQLLLSFLPFAHIIGKMESLTIHTFGWKQAFAESFDHLLANLSEIHPTILFSVPRIFEKGYNGVQEKLAASSPVRQALFKRGLETGRKYHLAIREGRRPSLLVKMEYEAAKRIVFKKVTDRFGGRINLSLCGGAPLPKHIGEFFQIVGIPIYEGYGLTETSAPVTLNTPDAVRYGTVGKPLPEVTLKIAEDGEILVKSKKVFKAYYKMEAETAEVLKKDWFATGDIGHIDSEGFLHVTDRKKDLIITSGGKNIAPQKIERLAKANSLITEFVVHGNDRAYLTALATLNQPMVEKFAHDNQILFSAYEELVKNPKVLALVQNAVDELNQGLASYETIKKFVILPFELSIEKGELTPSLKVRRKFINTQYKEVLDSMYTSGSLTRPGISDSSK